MRLTDSHSAASIRHAQARRLAAGIAAFCLLSGCISLAPTTEVPAVVAELPQRFESSSDANPYQPTAWWASFQDPVLDGFIDRALRSNLDIVEAVGRLDQARAQARLARSALRPTVAANGNGSFSSTPLDGNAFSDLAGGAIDRLENETYSLSLGASYELDLFGRARNDLAAARQDADASFYDLQTVQLASAAETISAYFDFVDTRRQIDLAKLTEEVLVDRAARTDDRFQRGLAESFELYQVRQDLRSTQASRPQLESALISARARLALVMGTYPAELNTMLDATLQPRLAFAPVPSGLPSGLLTQRPDVAAAWVRLEGARLRIGARKAERFPTISLSGSLGTQGGDPGSAFDFANNWTQSLAASIVAPIFDGGRISANIRSARAVYDQRAAAYARTVLSAYGEVESAIAEYDQQRLRYRLIDAQLREARASLDLQSRRFAAGVGSYTTYLDALRTLYQVESSRSSAGRATALARLGVHRALGGDWAGPVQPKALETRELKQGVMP
ncbi:MAG: TolC family protein [Pseudomonadota bacterium]